jgi:hypothetical protein
MLYWFRSRARAIAATLLLAFATLGASSALPHEDDCHGAACVTSVAPHDPSAHSIQSASSTTAGHPMHCVLCHWTRLLRPSIEVVHRFAPAIEDDGRVQVEVVSVPPVFPAAQPPLRSPPAPAPLA